MAKNTNTPPEQANEQPTIEELAARKGIDAALAAGLKARHAWPIGKRLPADEYDKAYAAFAGGHTLATLDKKPTPESEVTA